MNLTCLYLPPISANNKESIDLINFWKMAINRDRLVSVNVNLGEGYVRSFPETCNRFSLVKGSKIHLK